MNPLKVFIFFIAVLGFLFLLSIVFPPEGITLGEDAELRFASADKLIKKEMEISGYTDSLISHADVSEDPEYKEESISVSVKDTISKILNDSVIQARIDSISRNVYPLYFSGESEELLYGFFKRAELSRETGKLIRILHYGDSQIENDRMTSLLRYRFQQLFGGSGCGLIPAVPLYSGNLAFRQDIRGEWMRYTGFGDRDTTLDHSSYGVMACFTSVPPPDEELPGLHFEFRKNRRASRFSKVSVFLHAYSDSGYIAINVNDTIQDTLQHIQGGYQLLQYQPEPNVTDISFDFHLREGGRIYGISFDPASGVQVDNIAMRGSAGLEFSRFDRTLTETMLADLNPGMVILQFGGNVVPYIQNVDLYNQYFVRELNYIRSLCPSVPVIVIGPSDMSMKKNGQFQTYENLQAVRDALYLAAMKTGCGFWDMFEAMGGVNSIRHFVLADPPLANPDHIHFTPRGANLMAGLFFDAVMVEYQKYKLSANNP
ncbi:MAG: hypothetical protein K9J30_01005 [Bacteroidales bacterium]|nr:hypothetical protein [Bacteroidales bacterium]